MQAQEVQAGMQEILSRGPHGKAGVCYTLLPAAKPIPVRRRVASSHSCAVYRGRDDVQTGGHCRVSLHVSAVWGVRCEVWGVRCEVWGVGCEV
jgi:hypothetical protein